MKRSIIVAQSLDGVIGVQGKLPWRLPADLAFFKKKTYGHPIIMGRVTFESIGRVLPGRHHIVLTTQRGYEVPEGCTVVHDLEDAFSVAEREEVEESFVIGGTQVYQQALPMVDTIYMTQVYANVSGDSFFPCLDLSVWKEVKRVEFGSDSKNSYAYAFITYVRS